MGLGLKKNQRINESVVFKQVFASPDLKVFGKNALALMKTSQGNFPRLAVITKKKYFRTAVVRNLIKRISRESFRINQEKLGAFDIVLIFRNDILKSSRADIRKQVDELWQKVQKYSKKAPCF